MPPLLLLLYCLVILGASLAGGWVPLMVRLTHGRMQLAVSAVAGFMLGIGVLNILPHSLMMVESVSHAMWCLLLGFLAMFFIERFFCFHHHDAPDANGSCTDHGHRLTWSGAAVGLVLHSVIAGVALAASIHSDSLGSDHRTPPGLAVFLVILLHKPFDSLTLGTLMAAGGWSVRWRHMINGLFALAVPLGAVLFYVGAGGHDGLDNWLIGSAMAFAAGSFLCIASSDLLPELQFHRHDRAKLSAALIVGIALAAAVTYFEASHHDHDHLSTPAIHGHTEDHGRTRGPLPTQVGENGA